MRYKKSSDLLLYQDNLIYLLYQEKIIRFDRD
jgi:hypothetical protein